MSQSGPRRPFSRHRGETTQQKLHVGGGPSHFLTFHPLTKAWISSTDDRIFP